MAFLSENHIIKFIKPLFSMDFYQTIGRYVGLGKLVDRTPIQNRLQLKSFIESRASHIAQSSLYGYLKTRAGTRFPEMFENPGLLISINMAKWQIYLSCISDLAVYVGSLIYLRTGCSNAQVSKLIGEIVGEIIGEMGLPEDAAGEYPETVEALKIRVTNTDYTSITDDESAFSTSPEMLYKWSPIADELKKRDRIIVKNSIRFRWKDIRDRARNQIDAEGILKSL